MTKEEKEELKFYKDGAAEAVLKRFVFSEEEEKLVRDAIRTANRDNPRMALIHQADELLKEVAKTRDPIIPKEKTEPSTEAMTQLELLKLSSSKRKEEEAFGAKMPRLFSIKSKYDIIFVVAMAILLITVQYFAS